MDKLQLFARDRIQSFIGICRIDKFVGCRRHSGLTFGTRSGFWEKITPRLSLFWNRPSVAGLPSLEGHDLLENDKTLNDLPTELKSGLANAVVKQEIHICKNICLQRKHYELCRTQHWTNQSAGGIQLRVNNNITFCFFIAKTNISIRTKFIESHHNALPVHSCLHTHSISCFKSVLRLYCPFHTPGCQECYEYCRM